MAASLAATTSLDALSRVIASDMPEPRTLWSAWREMGETWRLQQADPAYQFNTPLPATATRFGADAPDELESSIGELAPDGLR